MLKKNSTAWSELPEPSNQSYFIWQVNIPRLIELFRCLVVSSANLFLPEPVLVRYCRLSLEDCYSNRLLCSHYKLPSLFRSPYRIIRENVRAFFPQGHSKLSVIMRCLY